MTQRDFLLSATFTPVLGVAVSSMGDEVAPDRAQMLAPTVTAQPPSAFKEHTGTCHTCCAV